MAYENTFYKVMCGYHLYVIVYRFLYPMVTTDDTHFGGDWKYLTHWNAMIQILYYITNGALLFNSDWKNKTSRFTHHVFACVVFPLAAFVTVMFWTLHTIDPSLVIDPNSEYQETAWMNHMKHTFVLFWVVVELVVVNHGYPMKFIGGATAFAVSGTYMVWVHVIYYVDSFWVYPILETLGWISRLLFCGAIVGFYQVLYLIGHVVNSKVHGNQVKFTEYVHKYVFDTV